GGHQFGVYGDCCSGIPGARHESTFASVNAVVSQLASQPELVCFLGDEIRGLVADGSVLRDQWRHWFQREMAWVDRDQIPLYHATGNHTAYDAASEDVFREVLSHLPRNGPPGQEGLSYYVRRGNLLLVFVNTMWSGLGDGRVETWWLNSTLARMRMPPTSWCLGIIPRTRSTASPGTTSVTSMPKPWGVLAGLGAAPGAGVRL
ncbi:MAG: metallophosphoesterase, partial [Bacillota bacterium]|nr:metallophosphoesterase [Bacillota bacterium]